MCTNQSQRIMLIIIHRSCRYTSRDLNRIMHNACSSQRISVNRLIHVSVYYNILFEITSLGDHNIILG